MSKGPQEFQVKFWRYYCAHCGPQEVITQKNMEEKRAEWEGKSEECGARVFCSRECHIAAHYADHHPDAANMSHSTLIGARDKIVQEPE